MSNPPDQVRTPTLAGRRPPWVVVTRADDEWMDAAVAELEAGRGSVIRLDGRELLTAPAVFDTFARVFSFPGYFGRNWDALIDCLHDWHGHGFPTRDVAVLIDRADGLLGTDFVDLLISVLCIACWHANLQLDADGVPHENRPPFTLHFVLLLDRADPAAFAGPAARDRDVRVTLTDGRLTATLNSEDWPDPT